MRINKFSAVVLGLTLVMASTPAMALLCVSSNLPLTRIMYQAAENGKGQPMFSKPKLQSLPGLTIGKGDVQSYFNPNCYQDRHCPAFGERMMTVKITFYASGNELAQDYKGDSVRAVQACFERLGGGSIL